MTEKNTTRDLYRRCFSTKEGRLTLTHLLADMGHFDADLKTPEERAVANYANKILQRMGIFHLDNAFFITSAYMDAPPMEHNNGTGQRDS